MTKRWRKEAQQAGISGVDGLLNSRNAPVHVLPITVELQEGEAGLEVVWQLARQRHGTAGPSVLDEKGLLNAFLSLAEEPKNHDPELRGADVLEFARRYGVLWLSQEGVPVVTAPWTFGDDDSYEPRQVLRIPVRHWRSLAQEAQAAIACAATLRGRGAIKEVPWRVLHELRERRKGRKQVRVGRNSGAAPFPQTIEEKKRYLEEAVGEWLYFGDVRASFSWVGTKPELELAGRGLMGAIARSLAVVISSVDGVVLCSGCESPYISGRKPRADQMHWCPTCREAKVPQREASRAFRERKRQGGA